MNMTLIQEMQILFYSLFKKHILSIDGQSLQNGDNPPDTYISKSEVVEKFVELLNEFGEICSNDETLKKELTDEINSEQNIEKTESAEGNNGLSSENKN
jgi:hypothetical protein